MANSPNPSFTSHVGLPSIGFALPRRSPKPLPGLGLGPRQLSDVTEASTPNSRDITGQTSSSEPDSGYTEVPSFKRSPYSSFPSNTLSVDGSLGVSRPPAHVPPRTDRQPPGSSPPADVFNASSRKTHQNVLPLRSASTLSSPPPLYPYLRPGA